MFSQQENHIPGTDARRRVCAYCCQEGDSSVKKITERALIGILAAFVEAQNRFRLETLGYAGEQVLTLALNFLLQILWINHKMFVYKSIYVYVWIFFLRNKECTQNLLE